MKRMDIYTRAIDMGNYIIETKATIRGTASKFSLSKSTVHKNIHNVLAQVNPNLEKEVQLVLNYNFYNKHLRGGEATKRRYDK